ncbi:hypothetical protein FN846DRAFT_889777 [Sphaerosporella brunnea]|uniref:Uncharacterized protein n=1 Tax=Sphaerosporella brunnea TaxID=1250544 RepID=A0A5J5EYU4_9PEZI|nr:hypothetical protein FN846DRAFT_889777 [Sphaerosporella brunnea]
MLCVNQAYVSAWCRRFCENSLPELPSHDHCPSSLSERLRIQRAFYRFWALSRAMVASGIKQPTISDNLSFATTCMLRYSLWEIAELTLTYMYMHQKLDGLCFLHESLVPDENVRSCFLDYHGKPPPPAGVAAGLTTTDDTANELTVCALAVLHLPMLYSLLSSPQTTPSILRRHVATQLSCYRTWSRLFAADRTNRNCNPTTFPPRCMCTRRDMPADEYDESLRGSAEDLGIPYGLEYLEDDVRCDLALWDDSGLKRLGFFLPVAWQCSEIFNHFSCLNCRYDC